MAGDNCETCENILFKLRNMKMPHTSPAEYVKMLEEIIMDLTNQGGYRVYPTGEKITAAREKQINDLARLIHDN